MCDRSVGGEAIGLDSAEGDRSNDLPGSAKATAAGTVNLCATGA
ncbi:MAG: hypothetical protein SNJ57_13040 [Cyanobacteriota bacterium]